MAKKLFTDRGQDFIIKTSPVIIYDEDGKTPKQGMLTGQVQQKHAIQSVLTYVSETDMGGNITDKATRLYLNADTIIGLADYLKKLKQETFEDFPDDEDLPF